jgi:peptidoglycan/LPS O-acetylase OafA/YrhL
MHYWALDFYRFFAAFVVSTTHFFIAINSSEILEYTATLGVDLFFVLSGFVLAPQLLRVQDSPDKHIKIFLIRRWMRTIPPYLFALTCAALLFGYGDALNFIKFLTYTQNFIADSSNPNFFPVAWSLSVEEWFYVFAPLLILVISKIYKNEANLLFIGLTIIILMTFIRLGLNDGLNWGEDVRRSVLMRFDAIFFGVIAYLLVNKVKMKYLIFVFTVSLIFLLFTGTNPILLSNSILLQNLFLPISSLFFSSIILFLTFIEIKSKKTKKIAKFCADVSYSMYLFHLFFIYFIGDFANNISLSFLVYISSLMSFCYLFFVLVEKPILDARPKFKKA